MGADDVQRVFRQKTCIYSRAYSTVALYLYDLLFVETDATDFSEPISSLPVFVEGCLVKSN